ncbi:hypothetical protein [Bordetella bronchiseptica]|uniref:hypothetical protein n=1 Tax=Bordetella bronchiseptica TaxID=518 RepID=UPI001268F46E|nr:hypothetical protein [Bordetella bronchiseptica]
MNKEIFVMLHPETLTHRMLVAAATLLGKNPLRLYPETPDRPAVLQVKCTQVGATDYGLIRLVLGEDGQSPAVALRPELLIAVLDSKDRLPVGFLSD